MVQENKSVLFPTLSLSLSSPYRGNRGVRQPRCSSDSSPHCDSWTVQETLHAMGVCKTAGVLAGAMCFVTI